MRASKCGSRDESVRVMGDWGRKRGIKENSGGLPRIKAARKNTELSKRELSRGGGKKGLEPRPLPDDDKQKDNKEFKFRERGGLGAALGRRGSGET